MRFSRAHVRAAVVTLEIYGPSVRLGYASVHPEVEATDQLSDGAIAFLLKILRKLCGPAWRPTEVLFARREPENVEPFQQFFRAPLRFNALQFAVVFPARWLRHRPPAADPALHARTLGRRLQAAGVTFQSLVDADRFERARQLLENTALEVHDIATSLDYADASAFIRAFRRWCGTTPGDWRARRAAARAVNRARG